MDAYEGWSTTKDAIRASKSPKLVFRISRNPLEEKDLNKVSGENTLLLAQGDDENGGPALLAKLCQDMAKLANDMEHLTGQNAKLTADVGKLTGQNAKLVKDVEDLKAKNALLEAIASKGNIVLLRFLVDYAAQLVNDKRFPDSDIKRVCHTIPGLPETFPVALHKTTVNWCASLSSEFSSKSCHIATIKSIAAALKMEKPSVLVSAEKLDALKLLFHDLFGLSTAEAIASEDPMLSQPMLLPKKYEHDEKIRLRKEQEKEEKKKMKEMEERMKKKMEERMTKKDDDDAEESPDDDDAEGIALFLED